MDLKKRTFIERDLGYAKRLNLNSTRIWLSYHEMVRMYVPPTAQIGFWRQQPPEKRDRDAIRAFAYDLSLTPKKYCLLYSRGKEEYRHIGVVELQSPFRGHISIP